MNFSVLLIQRLKHAWDWLLNLEVLEWVLPIFLASTAIIFELFEHVPEKELDDP